MSIYRDKLTKTPHVKYPVMVQCLGMILFCVVFLLWDGRINHLWMGLTISFGVVWGALTVAWSWQGVPDNPYSY